ncbi:MAG: type II toxin-antitoxin system VapC family toxin [Phycisphaerales bacterium]|jgi:tRNA(fMet)-specific endonuclease VapC
MKYLLDTNVCIRYLNGQSKNIRQTLDRSSFGQTALCSVVRTELLYGALKSAQPERNMERLLHFFKGFPCLPFDERASDAYAGIRLQLEAIGRPVGPNDLLIAATALAHELTLVTHNTKEFGRIEGLAMEDWETPAA